MYVPTIMNIYDLRALRYLCRKMCSLYNHKINITLTVVHLKKLLKLFVVLGLLPIQLSDSTLVPASSIHFRLVLLMCIVYFLTYLVNTCLIIALIIINTRLIDGSQIQCAMYKSILDSIN